MTFADQLTVARAAAVPVVVVLFAWDFPNHDYWATTVFAVAMATDWVDGWWARRTGRTSDLGRFLVTGLRLAALERGVVIGARDLGKLKTWAQAVAAGLGGLAAGGAINEDVAWWAMLVAVALTWLSGLDYARSAPRVLRGQQPA
jgi:CDP-diacylglycerol--glycerol-3-phosphate 3-phosphatidyltransferase